MVKQLLILILSFNSFVYAEDSVSLTKGTPAPFDGVLLSNEKANQVKNDMDLNASLTKSIDLYKTKDIYATDQINQLLDQNKKLADSLVSEQGNTRLENIVWFSLGVLATGLSIYAAKQTITK